MITAKLLSAINFIVSIINRLGQINIPGTEISVFGLLIGVWGIYFIWRWFLAQLFDIEVKK